MKSSVDVQLQPAIARRRARVGNRDYVVTAHRPVASTSVACRSAARIVAGAARSVILPKSSHERASKRNPKEADRPLLSIMKTTARLHTAPVVVHTIHSLRTVAVCPPLMQEG